MIIGISTACLYPAETEESLRILLKAGYRNFEVFFNTDSELTKGYLRKLSDILSEYDAHVCSYHLFASAFEPFMFFSNYPRRYDDGLRLYRRYAALAGSLGAKIGILHGGSRKRPLPCEEYCERYLKLARIVEAEGVTLAQENVARCQSASAAEVRRMTALLGDQISYVLDVKQALRAGEDPLEMLDAMGDRVIHLHLSDSRPGNDCLLPGAGEMDFTPLFEALKRFGYDGAFITEVYRDSFDCVDELATSLIALKGLVKGTFGPRALTVG